MITTSEVKVRYAETDQMGVVYHANYFVPLLLMLIYNSRNHYDTAKRQR